MEEIHQNDSFGTALQALGHSRQLLMKSAELFELAGAAEHYTPVKQIADQVQLLCAEIEAATSKTAANSD